MREFTDEYLRRCEPHWKPSGRKAVRNLSQGPHCARLSARCRSTASARSTSPRGSTRRAGTRPGAANRAFEILRSMMFRAEEWGSARARQQPLSRHRQELQGTMSPGSSTRTSWRGSGAPSTRHETRNGPRPSPPSGCWRSPDAAAAKCSISAGATSVATRSTWPTRRPARARCPSARPHGRMIERAVPEHLRPRWRSCFRATREGRGAYSRCATCWRAVCADAKLGRLRLHDPSAHRRQSRRHVRGEPAPGRQAARSSEAPDHGGLCPPR